MCKDYKTVFNLYILNVFKGQTHTGYQPPHPSSPPKPSSNSTPDDWEDDDWDDDDSVSTDHTQVLLIFFIKKNIGYYSLIS